ncbi:uncharacterized protein LTR77_008295 [Saxophila tyrrhenica]|uniref:Cytochrome P450 n=1 Tax=Saxophila tyrrhenica TaxID=1690608 RepID=A0AAV9P2G9_9PEZI|nr:hypothetical protein LTR77_008295 [Saxophila tyrrhenica]
MEISTGALALPLVGLAIFYALGRCLYILFFHPLSGFPGPKFAAIGLSELYYDVLKDGTYLWEIERMHKKYGEFANHFHAGHLLTVPGPIVRINARELHILDPEYYGEIYSGGSRRVSKDPATVKVFAVPTAMVATLDHMHHRARRGYLSHYFSKRTVHEVEPLIGERVDRLCGRFDEALEKKTPLNLDAAFSALTADVITMRFYGQHFDYLGKEHFHSAIRDTFAGVMSIYHLTRFLPGILPALKSLPMPIMKAVMPSVAELETIRDGIKNDALNSLKQKDYSGSAPVIASMLEDTSVPAEERTIDRLMDEGTTLTFAGTETTARSLSIASFYLLNDKPRFNKLRSELNNLPKSQDTSWALSQLQSLPYLTGVINECLRLAFGAAGRFSRVATEEALQYGDYAIPPGTPVTQSTYFVHTDPSIFPKPFEFRPERWIEANKEGVPLDRYLVSFSKGRRQCLGMTLAYAELYITIARVVSSYDMSLHNTTIDDIGIHHVTLVGKPKKIKGQGPTYGEVEVNVLGKVAQ